MAVQTVLTTTFNFYGDRQTSIPHKIDTPKQIDKNSAQLITSAVQIHPLGASGQMGKI